VQFGYVCCYMYLKGVLMKKLLLLSALFPLSLLQANPDYLSAVAAISTRGFVSLEQTALVEAQKHLSPATITPISSHLYHLTLVGFDLEIQEGLSFRDKNQLRSEVLTHLDEATHDAIKKTLKYLKEKNKAKTPIKLKFDHVEVFKKQVVGIFGSTKVVTKLVDTIENYFHNNISALKASGQITSVSKHQKILVPHVGLGKHTASQLVGTKIQAQGVADFHISKPESFSTVQLRTKKALPAAAAAAF
jgi:hypothetical protein